MKTSFIFSFIHDMNTARDVSFHVRDNVCI